MLLKKVSRIVVVAASLVGFSGCVAIPPLINVTHKTEERDLHKRLDSIDSRLDQLEKKVAPK